MSIPKSQYVSDVWKDGIFAENVVFCTGGGGTICSAQVRALVHLGANACIVGRNVEKTEKMAQNIATARAGARVLGLGAVDVRDAESLEKAAKRCAHELGGIDFVIAGAAGNFLAPMSHLSSNAFKAVMDIDVLGSYNTVKATLPFLIESAQQARASGVGCGGRIIFISATFHYTGTPLQTHLSVAKAGVDALSSSVAIEQGPRGITSNVIAPGPIAATEGMKRLAGAEAVSEGQTIVPLGRWGTVKDLADAAVYLFSDAGSFVNGEILVVDGGAWRAQGASTALPIKYPEIVLSSETANWFGKKAKL